jgi:hypothetical protein
MKFMVKRCFYEACFTLDYTSIQYCCTFFKALKRKLMFSNKRTALIISQHALSDDSNSKNVTEKTQ